MAKASLIETLYQECEGYLDLRALKAGSKPKQRLVRLGDWTQLKSFIQEHRDHDLFFGIATRDKGGGKKENIVHIPAVFIDQDFKAIPGGEQEAQKILDEFPLQPTIIVKSGGGNHLYWKLKEPSDKGDIERCEAIMKGLAARLQGDMAATDASRILRIPHTLNHKYKPARKVVMTHCNGTEFSLSDFDDFLDYDPDAGKARSSCSDPDGNLARIMACKFMAHCREDAAILPEPQWRMMITQLMREPGGIELIHELSRPYPKYRKKETEKKILEALNSTGPITCRKIKEHWDCQSSCKAKAPAALVHVKESSVANVAADATDANEADDALGCKMLQTMQSRLQTVANSPNYLETFKIWLESCDGEFKMQDAAKELGWFNNPKHYAKFRMAVSRAAQSGLIAKASRARGIYRYIDSVLKEMDIEGSNAEEFPLVLPLNLHELVEVNPKEIILIAGETNAGKSCLIFNILWDNIRNLEKLKLLRPKSVEDPCRIGLRYFSSEMGPAVVKKKLLDFGPAYPIQDFIRNVVSIERSQGFQDVLDPNGINCIDYLEAPDGDYYRMAPTITEIFSKLDRGVAVIAIQKRRNTDIGRGGEGTLEKPRLAISLSYDRDRGFFTAKITKAKIPRGGNSIDGKEIDFLIHRGVSIIPVSDWDYAAKHERRRKSVNYREDPQGGAYYGD